MSEEELNELERLVRKYVATHAVSRHVADAGKRLVWALRGVRGKRG